jgi:two-component system cell cycle response regulator
LKSVAKSLVKPSLGLTACHRKANIVILHIPSRVLMILIIWLSIPTSINAQSIEKLETTLSSLSAEQQISLLNDQKQLAQNAPFEEQARYWYLLATAYDQNNQIQQAIDAYSAAIDITEKLGLPLSDTLPRSYVERSYMKYIQTYDPDVYCGDRFKALDLSRQLAEPELLVKVLIQAAFCYGNQPEKLQQGLALLVEAIEVADKNEFEDSPYGMIHNASGNLYQQNQLFDKAYEYIQKAYYAWAKEDSYSDMFNMQHTLLSLAIEMKNFTGAQQHLEQMFTLAKEQPEFKDFTFFSHYNAGTLAYSQQQLPLAVTEFEKAIVLRKTTKEQYFVVQSLYTLAITYFKQGLDVQAQSTLTQLLIDSPVKTEWPLALQGVYQFYAGNHNSAIHLMVTAINAETDKRRTFIEQYQRAAKTLLNDSITELDNKVLQQTLEINRLKLAKEQIQKQLAQIIISISIVVFLALIGFLVHLVKTRLLFKHRAQIDHVTQIVNRRTIFELGYMMLQAALSNKNPFSLLILDIDHFKRVNDTLGHDEGGKALKLVCQQALNCLRQFDKIGRIGGEEFMLLLPNTNAVQALNIAQRIRMEIESTPLPNDGKLHTLTVSIGTAKVLDGEALESTMLRADKALYTAKKDGRNQVVMAN